MSAPGTVAFAGIPPDPVAAQVLRPNLDVAVGGWEGQDDGTIDLHDYCNDQSTATYLRRQIPVIEVCPTVENEVLELGIGAPTEDPSGESDTVVVRVNARYVMDLGTTGDATMRIRLREGTTTIATRSSIALSEDTFQWFEDPLSESEINSIGDWSNLRILVDIDLCVDTQDDEINPHVSEMELDIN